MYVNTHACSELFIQGFDQGSVPSLDSLHWLSVPVVLLIRHFPVNKPSYLHSLLTPIICIICEPVQLRSCSSNVLFP